MSLFDNPEDFTTNTPVNLPEAFCKYLLWIVVPLCLLCVYCQACKAIEPEPLPEVQESVTVGRVMWGEGKGDSND